MSDKEEEDPYYKNAQIALYIYDRLREWNENEEMVEELFKCIEALPRPEHRPRRRGTSTSFKDLCF